MELNGPKYAELLCKIPIHDDPDNGIRGARALLQHSNGEWWAGRITTLAEGDSERQEWEGVEAETAQDAIRKALDLLDPPT
ncbi:MAG: hypothetical protein ACREJD_10285 [Phycisphaerales bacterium]